MQAERVWTQWSLSLQFYQKQILIQKLSAWVLQNRSFSKFKKIFCEFFFHFFSNKVLGIQFICCHNVFVRMPGYLNECWFAKDWPFENPGICTSVSASALAVALERHCFCFTKSVLRIIWHLCQMHLNILCCAQLFLQTCLSSVSLYSYYKLVIRSSL